MQELDLTGLEITQDSVKIRLERNGTAPAAVTVPVVSPAAGQPAGEATSDLYEITSPMVGVFYSSPAENADPYVKNGDTIQVGDTMGIIEAMKLMNEITSDVSGTVEEICVKNGQVVEFGTVLFRIKR